MQAPVVVLNSQSGDRQSGRKAQLSNIAAAKLVADIIRSCLGPKAMLKMLLDPMGGIVLTNDGHVILREIEVFHPAAKSMIELSRTQDEEVGDGTTSVIILAGEILAQALPELDRKIHPVIIIGAYKRALADALDIIDHISKPIDVSNKKAMASLISASIGTKYASQWMELMCDLALKAVKTVSWTENGKLEIDVKRYAKIEKIPGGQVEHSRVLDGVMLNKDIIHPKMRRLIRNPRVVLLDCPLEYKKGESQTNIEITNENDWNRILQIEEEQIKAMCDAIIAVSPDLVITEKGVSDLAQHYFVKANVSVLRRVRKTDNNRIARATGATIAHDPFSLQTSDVGTRCGLFEVSKIGDEYFSSLVECKDPKACTILLRGPSKDTINEIERNLHDAMAVARNVLFHPKLSPGGGATEMAIAVGLEKLARTIEGVAQWPYRAVAAAMEIIPHTLISNAGESPVRLLTELRAKHAAAYDSAPSPPHRAGDAGKDSATPSPSSFSSTSLSFLSPSTSSWGVDGHTGVVVDMNSDSPSKDDNNSPNSTNSTNHRTFRVWEPQVVKMQCIKTAIESAVLLLRVDDIVAAKSKPTCAAMSHDD